MGMALVKWHSVKAGGADGAALGRHTGWLCDDATSAWHAASVLGLQRQLGTGAASSPALSETCMAVMQLKQGATCATLSRHGRQLHRGAAFRCGF